MNLIAKYLFLLIISWLAVVILTIPLAIVVFLVRWLAQLFS